MKRIFLLVFYSKEKKSCSDNIRKCSNIFPARQFSFDKINNIISIVNFIKISMSLMRFRQCAYSDTLFFFNSPSQITTTTWRTPVGGCPSRPYLLVFKLTPRWRGPCLACRTSTSSAVPSPARRTCFIGSNYTQTLCPTQAHSARNCSFGVGLNMVSCCCCWLWCWDPSQFMEIAVLFMEIYDIRKNVYQVTERFF